MWSETVAERVYGLHHDARIASSSSNNRFQSVPGNVERAELELAVPPAVVIPPLICKRIKTQ